MPETQRRKKKNDVIILVVIFSRIYILSHFINIRLYWVASSSAVYSKSSSLLIAHRRRIKKKKNKRQNPIMEEILTLFDVMPLNLSRNEKYKYAKIEYTI